MDIISAISTAHGTGGVAIVRISGDGALELAQKMFKPAKKCDKFAPNYMYAGNISGDGFCDFGFMVYFKAPKSFTGEDIVEFHCHGGLELIRGVLKKTLQLGARAAERGEFTRRAFLNGKLTLSSAEGMADMINAESLALLRAGSMLYTEQLSDEVKKIQSGLKDILAEIAVEIDYPEEDSDGLDFKKTLQKLGVLNGEIERLVNSYSSGKKIKNGVSVAICGKPNTGKSSLLNAILGYDKAIVSNEAGTTRDAVEGQTQINGVLYNFVDTAGIRESAGKVESIGIERAKSIILSADIVLSLTDGEGEAELPKGISGEIIRVFNKCDLRTPFGKFDIAISAKTGEGIENLKAILSEKSVGELSAGKSFIVEERHYSALKRAHESISGCMNIIYTLTPDLIAVDLKDAWDALGEITGETANEEIISTVFMKFCVGK